MLDSWFGKSSMGFLCLFWLDVNKIADIEGLVSLTEPLKIQDTSSSLKRRYVITYIECTKLLCILFQLKNNVPIILVVENEGTSFYNGNNPVSLFHLISSYNS